MMEDKMLIRGLALFIALVFVLFPSYVNAAEKDDALKAANAILESLFERRYQTLWDNQTSDFFKKQASEQSFLANMSIGRAQLGDKIDSELIDMSFSNYDPATGHKGRIYAFNYLNTYSVGRFYERIVVIKEPDGNFRLAGIWGSPAPTQ